MKTEFLPDDYLLEVQKRVEAATPGPWTSFIEGRDQLGGDSIIRMSMDDSIDDLYLNGASIADQDFIAHAREDIPLLLREIERLKNLLTSNGINPKECS